MHLERDIGSRGISEAELVLVAPAVARALFVAMGVGIRNLPLVPEYVGPILCEDPLAAMPGGS